MLDYSEISIQCRSEINEMLIAELYNQGYEGFWESDTGLKAYISSYRFDLQILQNIINKHIFAGEQITFRLENIPPQNWNEEWEKNFEPVIIADKFIIKAPFHFIENKKLTHFTISPKMAFGTGHHSTTQLMIELMLSIDFVNKKVLDFGTGTGILAIFAEHLGAAEIMAFDNSSEAVDCASENIIINNCSKIKVSLSDLEQYNNESFDLIIANINRNILAENALNLSNMIKNQGSVLISGFYESDIDYISTIFEKVNLSFLTSTSKNTWVACQYIKN
jgi:ribosomal protein L11 methyltransferase